MIDVCLSGQSSREKQCLDAAIDSQNSSRCRNDDGNERYVVPPPFLQGVDLGIWPMVKSKDTLAAFVLALQNGRSFFCISVCLRIF